MAVKKFNTTIYRKHTYTLREEFVNRLGAALKRVDALEAAVGIESGGGLVNANEVMFGDANGNADGSVNFLWTDAAQRLNLIGLAGQDAMVIDHNDGTYDHRFQFRGQALNLYGWSDTSTGVEQRIQFVKNRGSSAAELAVLSGDRLGAIYWNANSTASAFERTAASIQVDAVAESGGGYPRGDIKFYTRDSTNDTASTTGDLRMTIDADGAVIVATKLRTPNDGEFADDTAAGVGGIAIGQLYWNTTNNALHARVV